MGTTRRTFITRASAFAATVGAAGVLAACGDDDEASGSGSGSTTDTGAASTTTSTARAVEGLTVMMPFPIGLNFIADIAAESSGAMEAEGVDLDLQFATGAPQALQQLAGGNVHVIRNGPVETIRAIVEQGAPFITIGMPNQNTGFTLSSAPENAYAIEDLGGLTVGMPTLGGNAEFTLDIILRSAGLDPASVGRQAVGSEASAWAVLEEGVVDVLFVSRSTMAAIRALGEEPHVDLLQDVNPLLGTNLVSTRELIDARHDTIVGYLAALHATKMALNVEETRIPLLEAAAAGDQWDLPALDDIETASRIVESTATQWFEEGEDNLLRNIPERWEQGVAELIELGIIPEGTQATDLYTNDLLDEALG
jgi:ABC-type nitrate/sulfonate/bicarbonate transport system substrate-binding protein